MSFEEPWRSNSFEVFQMSHSLIFGFAYKVPFSLGATELSEIFSNKKNRMRRINLCPMEGWRNRRIQTQRKQPAQERILSPLHCQLVPSLSGFDLFGL